MNNGTGKEKPKLGCWTLLSRALLCGFAILLVVWNLRFYSRPTVVADYHTVPPYAEAQLRWIRGQLESGSGERMQALFPEGWYFSYLLYGLSWVELALRDSELRGQALTEARWALSHIESDKGKAPFPADLGPEHGMFYSAWRNHLLSGILLIQPVDGRNAEEWALFEERCAQLAATLKESVAPFPASYRGQSWPCDSLPAIHSLKVYDAMAGEPRYESTIHDWLSAAQQKVDPRTGLLPHTAEVATGDPLSEARATSQTIILRFLQDIDSKWAVDQYRRFREHYYVTRLGVRGIREWPRGVHKSGDVDSGPLIFGLSGSATVVGMGVASSFGDFEFARAVSQAGEAFGIPFGTDQRRYLGGILPIGDTFLVHASSARPWLAETVPKIAPQQVSPLWRWGVHLASLVLLILFWVACKIVGFAAGKIRVKAK